jgi:hypothetical protein
LLAVVARSSIPDHLARASQAWPAQLTVIVDTAPHSPGQ